MRAWYSFYPKDFMIDTLELSLEEECLYRRLIDLYYMNGGPLIFDEVSLGKSTRIHRTKLRHILPKVLKFFVIIDGKMHHSRIDAELKKAKEIQERRAESGRKGGRANAKNKPEANAEASHNHTHKHIYNNKLRRQPKGYSRGDEAGGLSTPKMEYSPQEIVDLYHKTLPDLIQIKRITPKLIEQIHTVHAMPKIGCNKTQHWENFFRRVSRSDWLTGRAKNEPSRYSLRGLLDIETYTKIAEGQYDNR